MDKDILIELDDYLEKVNNVPPLKPTPSKILTLLKKDNIDTKRLADLISKDPSLTANILKYANSPFFGFKNKINSIPQIISLLGIKEIKKLTLIHAVKSRMTGDLNGYGITSTQLWRHSVSTAIGAQFLSQLKGIYPSEDAFTAGILIDLGKIILNDFLIKKKIELFKEENQIDFFSFHKIEKELFGIDHSEIAAILLKKWDFPEQIVISIRYHHYPSAAPKSKGLSSVVHLADLVSSASLFNSEVKNYENTVDPFALKTLKIKFYDLKELIDLMREEIENAEKEFL